MKTQLFRFTFLLSIFLTLPLTTAAQVVDIPDSNLRAAIGMALNKASGATITAAEMETLDRLEARNANIRNLTGLKFAINLTNLNLANNMISDISPVAGLTNLIWLSLVGNTISDLSPLVANSGLGSEDKVGVHGNSLNYASIRTHIPALQERGVEAIFDNRMPRTIRMVSGDDQEGSPDAVLASPFIVEVQDGNSVVFEGVPVTFSVTAGGGTLSSTNTTTNANGRTESVLTLGPGAETNTVEASVAGIQEKQIFNAEGIRTSKKLEIISGDEQQGPPGTALEKAFVVEVRDQSDQPLPEVQVTFSVSSGGGTLSATSVTTDANGRAESRLTLDPEPGTNTVVVTVTGVQGEQTFTAEGVRVPTSLEIISGDNQPGRARDGAGKSVCGGGARPVRRTLTRCAGHILRYGGRRDAQCDNRHDR